jgi:hypothetical protein
MILGDNFALEPATIMISVRHANSRRRQGQLAGLALIMMLLSSCASTMPSPDAPSSSPGHPLSALNQRWVKVETNPPTWYPRGTPADCSTDYRNGDWIYTENAAGNLN